MTTDLFFRFATLALFIIWRGYWLITEKKADKEKQKTRQPHGVLSLNGLEQIGGFFIFLLPLLQLLGLPVLVRFSAQIQPIGFILCLVGFVVAIIARVTLGTNWANSHDYQIKKGQEIVTTGIYGYIRHPIYSSIMLFLLGAELVARSYLVFVYLSFFLGAYLQARREERLLQQHFGKTYTTYMKRSKMFIPFIW